METMILTLLLNNLAPQAVPAKLLAHEIVLVAREYRVDAETLARIVVVESAGVERAFNKKTQDYGIVQINAKTIQLYGSSINCAMQWTCGLRLGAKVLKDMQKYAKSKRPCHYNLGPRPMQGLRLKTCEKYEQKLASID